MAAQSHAIKIFIMTALTVLFLTAIVFTPAFSQGVDDGVTVWTNQVGYVPGAGKFCVLPAGEDEPFEVVDAVSNKTVFTGTLAQGHGRLRNLPDRRFQRSFPTRKLLRPNRIGAFIPLHHFKNSIR